MGRLTKEQRLARDMESIIMWIEQRQDKPDYVTDLAHIRTSFLAFEHQLASMLGFLVQNNLLELRSDGTYHTITSRTSASSVY